LRQSITTDHGNGRPVTVIGRILRWASVAAAVLVVLGFVYFAAEETARGSSEQVAGITDEGVTEESEREARNGSFREFVEDANDVLVSPFENIIISDDAWVSHGVPALLAFLVYGLGVLMLLNYLVPGRER
jgi:hypothetical protein